MRTKQSHTVEYEIAAHWNELGAADQQLITEAQKALDGAYAPYSNFKVGAALLLQDGEIITGNNQENVAFPSGMCAERVALFYAGASFPGKKVVTLAIAARGNLLDPTACISPCGSCRQVMAETENRQKTPIRLLLTAESGLTYIFERTTDLLLFPFGITS